MICQCCGERFNELYGCGECNSEVCWDCGNYDGTCKLCDVS